MSFRLINHTPSVGTAPGETVTGRIEIHNDGASSAVYTVSVVGLDPGRAVDAAPAATRVPVGAGQSAVVDVAVVVPRTLGIGQHAAAFEVASSRPDDRPALSPFTLSIASVSRVELTAVPSTIRARRRADFHLDITNNEALPVDVAVSGEAPDVAVAFTPEAFTLQPGQRAVAKGKVKGPRHWSGEPTQHNLLITARGRASSTSLTTPYVQKPLFAHRARMVVAGFTVVALWLAAIGGVALWLSSRDDATDTSAEIIGIDTDGDGIVDVFRDADGGTVVATDTDGDGIPDSFVDENGNIIPGTDTDGDGIPDTLRTPDGEPIAAVDTDGDGIPDALSDGSATTADDDDEVAGEPEATIVRGTISLDGDTADATNVAISLTPITLGTAPDPAAAPVGFRSPAPEQPRGKIWSTRHGSLTELLDVSTRRTLSIAPAATQPNADGVWLFTDVLEGQSYEISFAKPGYDTQSFVVTPADDGEPIDMEVDMSPARGSLSGTVNGPSGVLGGADITITDGTLEFQTTSDSRTGEWSIEGISTPGVYTMSAALRGYATAVRQVELTPGQETAGITLQMQPGLGTLTGHIVDSTGAPVGGVTVTASNGDTTLSSTSLTHGDIGFYSLPQLDVPATYTITAELEGFVAQSRRVPLNGSLAGVDFTMTSETITLRGRVMSSSGGGIESAGLIISTGDLVFRSSTSAAPSPGIFSLDRLPPGTYTITVEHYLHESATEFITVKAGETPPPLDITLQRTNGPPQIGMGSLSVKVVNNDVTGVPIEDATVTIKRNRSTEPPRTLQGGNALGVTFDEVSVGTYTVLVTKEGFNASRPETVSVGLNHQEVTVRLQALGSASGTIVDSLTGAVLDNYVVTLQQVDAAGNPLGPTYGPFAPSDTDQVWSTDSRNLLPTGTYRMTVDTPPLGYRVAASQTPVVDPPEYAQSAMRFTIPVVTNQAVPALSVQVEADPYPTFTGRVFAPLWDDGQVAYTEIDDDSLTVVATCNGKTVQDITYSSNGGNAALRDEYTIDKTAIAAVVPPADLPATCDLQIKANGRSTGVAKGVAITPSNGNNNPDRLIATALVKPAPTLEGTVFWRDENASSTAAEIVPVDAAIATAAPGEAITGFVSVVAPVSAAATRPSYETDETTGKITGSSDSAANGSWVAPTPPIKRQIFGAATYTFQAAGFTTASTQFLIDETGTATFVPGTEFGRRVTPGADGFAVEMRPPDKGSISGTVRIDSTTRSYPANMVSASGPGSTPPPTTPDATTGAFTFPSVDAGTWTVAFTTPPNHERITPTGGSITQRVNPGTPTAGFDAHFVEQGTIEVRLFDKFGTGEQITPDATFTLSKDGVPVTEVTVADANTAGVYRITGIPVDATDPTGTPVDYDLDVSVDGYDMNRALLDGAAVDADAIDVPMVAGQVRTIDLSIAEYRTITTALVGNPSPGVTEPLSVDNGAEITVTRLDAAPADDPEATVVSEADGSLTVTGPPGIYRIAPTHPEYRVSSVPTGEAAGWPSIPGTGVYVIPADQDVTLGDFEFEIRPGMLSIEAVTQLTGGEPVTGAHYVLYEGTAPCTADAPGEPLPTSPIEVRPGSYCLAINKLRPGGPPAVHDAFPAIIQLTIPRGTADAPSETTVVAPLPSLQPSLVGRLVAENANGEQIELVADPAPTITRMFTSNVDAEVNSAPATNLAEDPVNTGTGAGTSVIAQGPVDPATDQAWTYTFVDVPFGVNEITAPAIPGYTPDEARTQETTVTTAFGPMEIADFVYTAASTDVAIDIGAGTFPSLDTNEPTYHADRRAAVTLTAPNGTTTYTEYTFEKTGTTNLIVIPDVAAATGNFRLEFDDALHEAVDQTFAIPQPIVDGRRIGTITAPAGDMVRLTGTALQQNGANPATNVIALQTGATITVSPDSTLSVGDLPSASRGFLGDGRSYFIDVPPGTRNVQLAKAPTPQGAYESQTVNNVALSPGGSIVERDLRIRMMSKVVVTTYTGEESTAGLADPTPLNVRLRRTGTGSDVIPVESTVADPGAVPPVISGRYTFVVPAGEYGVRATSAPGTYPDQVLANQTFEVGSGWSTDQVVKMPIPRYVDVTVSPAEATVTIGGATPTVAGALRRFSDVGSTGIPSTGQISNGTVTATGYRNQSLGTIPAEIYTSRSVTLYPLVTVSGTIPGASVGTGTITATRTGSPATTKTGNITTVGGVSTYAFTGLDVGTWTVSYAEQGAGATAAPVEIITITGTLPASGTATGPEITLVPRDVNFDFTVNRAGSGSSTVALAGATVTILAGDTPLTSGSTTDDVPGPPNTTGTRRLTIPENSAPTRWTITHPDYLEHRGTITSFSLAGNTIGAWTMRPAVKGAASGGTDPLITICAGTLTTICSTPAVPAFTATGGTITYNGVLADGTYTVFATATGVSGRETMTVGTASRPDLDITMAAPTP